MWNNLPTEISTDILHRLGVKTLIKCTILSKSFLSLITSPDFISTHIAKHTNSQLLLRYFTLDNKEIYHFEPDDDTFSGFQSQGLVIPFRNYEWFNVAGCVNGVLCLVNDFKYEGTLIILWNPSIRKFVRVPEPIIVFKAYGGYESVCGFGFDSISDDYKVVRVVNLDYNEPPTQIEVFSLKSGRWRLLALTGDVPNYTIKRYDHEYKGYIPCFSNGSIYWIGYDYVGPSKHVILKFDLFKETFEIIQVPEVLIEEQVLIEEEDKSIITRPPMDLYVEECKGNLTLIKRDYKDAIKTCRVWLMKEDEGVKTWTKMLDFDIARLRPCSMPRAFAFRKSGEIIMVKGGKNAIFGGIREDIVISTDLVTHDDTLLREISAESLSFYLSSYVESMVLFKEGKGIGEQTTQLDLF